ncbi:acyl-CoA reductase [Budvicia diplopodorum]|uniref:acyl-CoA reductase n=1 Tax=Budvicia diplopodorum TaxID=1119056 RepID=UPI00135C86ED|nr:acyl-CoA reductase [Budvicia diplopodorum]
MSSQLAERVAKIKQWIGQCAESYFQFSADPETQAFCLARLRQLSSSDLLEQKVANELADHIWRPPHRLLFIISEKDPLGTLEGFLVAYLIGSKMRIKARHSRDWLIWLRQELGLSADDCEIYDWQSQRQDDQRLLSGVDTVLLAGGEDLIRHYRNITPVHIRLIELGPKISGMALFGQQIPPIENIVKDTCLFLQCVCSSPRFILAEDESVAEYVYSQLQQRLDQLPPLPENQRLQQLTKSRELAMHHILQPLLGKVAYSPASGWGVTLTHSFIPAFWLPHGFQIIVGPIEQNLYQAELRWPGRLQTLGYWGKPACPQTGSFTRYCPVGTMHARSLLAPHDGFFILPSLVRFIHREDYPL